MESNEQAERLLRRNSETIEGVEDDDIQLAELDPLGEERKNFLPPDECVSGFSTAWSAEEEKQLVRKLDRLVMPLLIIAFFALQLDRG
jgi:hypothetical protein